jgi:hypothetical protein
MTFHLSDHSAPVDLSALIDTRLLVQANSGGGKSWCLRRILEQTHGRAQHLVIDPEGEFASLRERFDYVLAARQGGDTAADPRSAKLLAERLLELGASAVLDIYELKAHERIRFVRAFLEALVDAPKKLWHPALVVVDEAHVYCPQVGEAESAGAVIDLATRGRKRGFCAILATQRLSKLHKDAAAECNNKLIGRTGLDVDMKRAGDELGFTKDRLHELRELDAGHFFAFGPAISRSVTKVHVGGVQTTHPKTGSRIAFTAPPPTEKVRALLPKLADLPAEAEARQKTVEDLKRELATARRELTIARQAAPAPAPPKVERIEVPVLVDEDRAGLREVVQSLRSTAETLGARADQIEGALRRVGQAPMEPRGLRPMPNATRQIQQHVDGMIARAARKPVTPSLPRRAAESNGNLTGPEQRILDAIAWLAAIGVSEPEQAAVAFLAGYTYGGGAFNNPRGSLRTRGLVDYRPGERIVLTVDGAASANAPDAPLTAEELQARVLARLPGPEQRLLRPLLAAYPDALSNEDLAGQANYTPNAGAFNNPRGRLRSLGLIDYPRPGYVVAKPLLFLEERS